MSNNCINYIKEKLNNCFDVKYREIRYQDEIVYVIFIDNLCDSKFISEYIIAPIMRTKEHRNDVDFIKSEVLFANSIGDVSTCDEAISHISCGDAVMLFSFSEKIIFCEAKGFNKGPIDAPQTEAVIRGPNEGFNESINDTLSLIRRKIKNPKLKFENFIMGESTNTLVVISYIEGIAPIELINQAKTAINSIKPDSVMSTNIIEERLSCKNTFFNTIGYSEKPDIVASKLLEGRVAIIVDGTPFVITLPYFFIENFQTPEDYSSNKYIGNFSRIIRVLCFLIALLVPGLFISLTTHHFSLTPTVFVFRLAISRAGVPFPTLVEIFLMQFFFQISREAGKRLPSRIGTSLSIVSALILGDAAVGSGLASQTTLVVVGISSIASFTVPQIFEAILVWSTFITIFSSILGLPGFYFGFIVFVAHIAALDSCGYPFLFPLGTYKAFKHKDILYRRNLNNISHNIFKEEEKK